MPHVHETPGPSRPGRIHARLLRIPGLAGIPLNLAPALLLFGLLAAGCASAPNGTGTDLRALTQSEIQDVRASHALEVIQLLRPRWLQSRGERSFGAIGQNILVYENDARLGTVEEVLHLIPAENIVRMEWVDGSRAGLLPGAGSGHVEAAILIYTARRPS